MGSRRSQTGGHGKHTSRGGTPGCRRSGTALHRSDVSLSPRVPGSRGRWGCRRARTSGSKTPCGRDSTLSTHQTFWTARRGFGPGAVPLTPDGPSTSACPGARGSGYGRRTSCPASTAWSAPSASRGSQCGAQRGRLCDAVGRACPWGYVTARRWWSQSGVPLRGRCSHRYGGTSLGPRSVTGGARPRGSRGCGGKRPCSGMVTTAAAALRAQTRHDGGGRYVSSGEGVSDCTATRTRRGSCPVGVRRRGNNGGPVRPPATFWAARARGRAPGRVEGGWAARQGGRAADGPSRPSTTGVVAIGTHRSRHRTPRAVNACAATATPAASAATCGVGGGSSKPRSGRGTHGGAVAASARA
jgi:hypothetical protein